MRTSRCGVDGGSSERLINIYGEDKVQKQVLS